MRDSVPSPRYSPVCNVLRQWKTSLIPTYRVYRLYDTQIEKDDIRIKKNCVYFISQKFNSSIKYSSGSYRLTITIIINLGVIPIFR